MAISSVLDIEELGEEVLWRSVGILNASKGLMLLVKEGSPILDTTANFNWEQNTSLISKKLSIFKNIEESGFGVIYTEKDNNTLQKKLEENRKWLLMLMIAIIKWQ